MQKLVSTTHFSQVPRPDGIDDTLGLLVLDEPSTSKQSDASLLSLRLRALAKDTPLSADIPVKVKTAKTPNEINAWIDNLRKLKQETTGLPVQTLRLYDIDNLMQEWDPEVEVMLRTVALPPSDLDCSLEEYVSIICSIVDIPVHGSRIASLHQLFTLYNEFRSSQHFKQID